MRIISDNSMPRRLSVGVAALLCLVAANAFAISGLTTSASDTVAKNGKLVTDCSAAGAQLSGSLVCSNGRIGGQLINGGNADNDTLTLVSTAGNPISSGAGIRMGGGGYDEVHERFGIGISVPTRGLDVVSGTTGETLLNGSNGEILSLAWGTNTSADALWLGQARGNRSSAAHINSGDQMGGVNFVGHDGTNFASGARILGVATQDWGGSAHGSEMRFSTTPTGSTTGSERLRINASGTVQIMHTGNDDGVRFQDTLSDRANFQLYFNDTLSFTTDPPSSLSMIPIIMRQTSAFNKSGTSQLFTPAAVINEQHWKIGDGDKLFVNTNYEGAFRDAPVFERTGTTGQIFSNATDVAGFCTSNGVPNICCTGSGTGPTCQSEYWSFETNVQVTAVTLPVFNSYVVDTPTVTSGGAIALERGFYVRSMQGTTKVAFGNDDTAASERFAGPMRVGATGAPIASAKLEVVGNVVSAETSAFIHANMGGL